MTIELVYRVRCSGPCRGWLSHPDDYELGEEVPLAALEPKPTAARAGMWPDETAARRAAFGAGWSAGTCPDCAAEPSPVCQGFVWIGQSFATCDRCGQPAWEHAGEEVPVEGAGPFDSERTVRPWKPGQADAIRAKWAPEQPAAAPQPKEADNPRTVCVCGHTRGEHATVGGPFGRGRLLCAECTDVCKEFEAL